MHGKGDARNANALRPARRGRAGRRRGWRGTKRARRGGGGGVGDHRLEHGDVLLEPLAAVRRQAAERLRAVVLHALPDLDEPRLLQHLQLAAQVAVGERAQRLEVVEQQARVVARERREDAEPGLLVDDALEAVVRVPAGRAAAVPCRRAPLPLFVDRVAQLLFSVSAMVAFQRPPQHAGRQQLAGAEHDRHRPRPQRRRPCRPTARQISPASR